jgi:hypothetical protein
MKACAPQPFAYDSDLSVSGFVLVGGEDAPNYWLDTERGKAVGRRKCAIYALGSFRRRQVEAGVMGRT